MGLETVELVLEVEERFGITIPDDEAAAVETVDDLTRLVLSRVAAGRLSPCPTFRAFMLLRSDIRSVLPEAALRARPRQRIADVVPRHKRRALWGLLRRRIGTPPDLQRPVWLRNILLAAASVLGLIGLAPAAIDTAILPLSIFVAVIVLFFLYLATRPFCWVPPAKMATFGDAARLIAGTKVAMAPGIAEKPESLIREEVRDIIAHALGVNRDKVVPRARFVSDLGAG